jgi:DNA-binding transcriptional LysR family regulator
VTAAGEEVARQARRVAQQLREAGEALDAMKGVRGGRLSIGVVSTAKYFAPRLLAEFRRRKPGIEIDLHVHNREIIVRQLADRKPIWGRRKTCHGGEACNHHPIIRWPKTAGNRHC